MFKRLFYRIKKLFEFSKLGWKIGYWDYSYLYDLERFQLEKMANCIEKDKAFEGYELIVRDIRLCIRLIDIILEDDTCTETDTSGKIKLTKYVNTKNAKRFGLNIVNENIKSESLYSIYVEELRIKKAINLYHEIRKEKTREW